MDLRRFFDFQSLLELDLASDRDLDGVEQPLAVDIDGCTFRKVAINFFRVNLVFNIHTIIRSYIVSHLLSGLRRIAGHLP